MAHRTGVALHGAVRDGAVACDDAMRNAGPTTRAVAGIATAVGAGGTGSEAAHAVTSSPARRGMKATAMKTASGMKATAAAKTASGMKASATMETAATPEAAAPTTMKTAAPATATGRLGNICEHQPCNCAREDRGEHQRNPFAARSSQHVFLHPAAVRNTGSQSVLLATLYVVNKFRQRD